MAVNFKNTFENTMLFVSGALLGAFITYKAMRLTTADILLLQAPIIKKAIDKETIKNEIINEIDLKIDKIKKSDTIQININQKPVNNQKPKNQVNKNIKLEDSVRKGFFGRLLSKEKYKKVE